MLAGDREEPKCRATPAHFVDRFLERWNRRHVDGALALITDDCVWGLREAVSRMAPSTQGVRPFARRSWRHSRHSPTSTTNPFAIVSARTMSWWNSWPPARSVTGARLGSTP